MKNDVSVVLAHGGWADGSSWARVITGLAAHGIKAVAAPLPLTELADDVEALNRSIGRVPGPLVLAAHAYAGAVIGLARPERVKALVYVTSFAPDDGEKLTDLFFRTEPHPQAPNLAPDNANLLWLPDDAFPKAFAQNASAEDLTVLKATQRPLRFSDGVFAVLITVLVLELRPPDIPTFKALLSLWPTWLSYAVSYLFIAIVWANHHHLLHFASEATPRLMWFNFGHLFSVSLLPLATAWMAVSRLAPQPVAFYAAVFFFVNVTYICLIRELIETASIEDVPASERKIMRFRSITTLCAFGAASLVALRFPLFGLGMCICCLIVYLRPDGLRPGK